ncbi:MAG: NAD(P)H-hydrate dehydratase [Betaproteobacteria bacterium]
MSLPLFSRATIRRIEARHADAPLMQRAGEAAAKWARDLAKDIPGAVLVFAGPGNNGGDAFETAYWLLRKHFAVHLVFSGDPSHLPADATAAYSRFIESGGLVLDAIPTGPRWRLIIDGLFGIGLSSAPEGIHADWIAAMNFLSVEHRCPLLALDCPTGLNVDSGRTLGIAVRATHTLTFIAAKPGLLTGDGPDHCGEVCIADLDVPLADEDADGRTIDRDLFAPSLRPRAQNTHKGTYGSAGVLGGAHSMLGALFLAGRAALKLGAGRVYLGALAPEAPALDFAQPELMLRKPDGVIGASLQALACGPGLGTSLQATRLVEHALSLDLPLVLDADALNLLALEGNLQTALAARQAPSLLTPHPAEAARLLDADISEVANNRCAAACDIASRFSCHVALKGCGTIVAAPDGRWWLNTTGSPALATAGSGDVLTGMALSLLTQGWEMEAAALAAVHLHGAAADTLVAEGVGPIGLTAGELIDPARRLLNQWIAAR